ncbi:FAD-binding oxidoreductase [Polynucleobacter sp. MWH-Loch1C5]|uniref:FAD-binding oxidoreductase n=1 Tax=Polynucleobacter sp. MWH-Loch1C5 TaxID=2689108 RepID=UPI001C0B1436|nr:FAD-binding oxidoreductase [Polynucleobacter sp. MWH-Loch1C5]MBU3543034.1 FAD-binding oxidoreductase [Polynucleobacter sp. MWH-Loch1C5]
MNDTQFIQALQAIVGQDQVITEASDLEPYLIDWRKRYRGTALAAVRPANTHEVAAVVQLCAQEKIALVPQGGNTGMCGGATPNPQGRQIVVSLQRMNRVREVDTANQTITVEAGCILQAVQEAASAAGRYFPLSLGAEGSCSIGGNLSTNAGGTSVLRYGNARELCLGLEVVTPQGQILNSIRGLRKDNTGYDLRDLYIGAEGTLGIITAAVLKLFPIPVAQWTALVAVPSAEGAVELLSRFQAGASAQLTGFEVMSREALDLLKHYYPALASPLAADNAYEVLVEISDYESAEHAMALMEKILEGALESGCASDAAIASNLSQARKFWDMREHIPLAQADDGPNIKHDVSLPISAIPQFVSTCDEMLRQRYPGIRIINYGHLGDGNLHYNVAGPSASETESFFVNRQKEIQALVYAEVEKYSGSISAEHGVGQQKVGYLPDHRGAVAFSVMQSIKRALDPDNLMNPGKVIAL